VTQTATPSPIPSRRVVLTLCDTRDDDSRDRRLRAMLKYALRVFGWRCVSMEERRT
jgi:hypothetical protein